MTSKLNEWLNQNQNGNTVIHLPEGMLGFSRLTRYVLVKDENVQPILWLQSLDDNALAFPVVDPHLMDRDYSRLLPSKEIASLKIKTRDDLLVLAVVILRPAPAESSVNLKAPLLINHTTMVGRQIILTESEFGIRAPVSCRAGDEALSAPMR
jgi:flagellar assembly factor FliW